MSVRTHGDSDHGPSVAGSVDLEGTRERLDRALNDARSAAETRTETDEPTIEAIVTDAKALIERAAPSITAILGTDEKTSLHETHAALGDLYTVVDEAVDLLETVNVAALPDAVDFRELPAVIETDNIPEALDGGDLSDVVEFRRLVGLVDLGVLFEAVDFRALVAQKAELDEAVTNASDNLAANSDEEADTEGGLSGGLQRVYERTEETSDAVTGGGGSRQSSRSSLMHSTVASTNRLDMQCTMHFSPTSKR